MKTLLAILSITLFASAALAGPTKKSIDCDHKDYSNITDAVEQAMDNESVRTNDMDMLNYIKGGIIQEIGGFNCKKVFYIEPIFSVPESTSEFFELEDSDFKLSVEVTTNVISHDLESVNVELLEAK